MHIPYFIFQARHEAELEEKTRELEDATRQLEDKTRELRDKTRELENTARELEVHIHCMVVINKST